MKLATIFLVRNPSEISVLEDCFSETTVARLADYIRGSEAIHGQRVWTEENTTIYTERGEAIEDAKKRIAKRDAKAAKGEKQ